MVERNGKNGLYWGCPEYPQCRGSAEMRSSWVTDPNPVRVGDEGTASDTGGGQLKVLLTIFVVLIGLLATALAAWLLNEGG